MPTSLSLGNVSVLESTRDENDDVVKTPRRDLGNQITSVEFPDGMSLVDQIKAVADLWPYHSDDPPEWVESDNTALAQVIAANFTWPSDDERSAHTCSVGRPKQWEETS
jgi:hypothetical protein